MQLVPWNLWAASGSCPRQPVLKVGSDLRSSSEVGLETVTAIKDEYYLSTGFTECSRALPAVMRVVLSAIDHLVVIHL